MRILGRVLTAAALAALASQGMAAAPRVAGDSWIGVWGYVLSPPAPGPAPAPFVPPAPVVTPLTTPVPPPPPPAPRVFPPPLLENPGNVPIDGTATDIRNTTVRQLVRVSADGSRLRLRFSAEDSADALSLGAVHVGLAAADGAIVPGSD